MLDKITKWFKGLFESLWNAYKETWEAIINTVLDMLKDLFFWIIDSLLGFVVPLIDTILSPLTVFNPQSYINDLPADFLNIWGLLGLGSAMAIVVAALLIRLTMQLIPFVRLGS